MFKTYAQFRETKLNEQRINEAILMSTMEDFLDFISADEQLKKSGGILNINPSDIGSYTPQALELVKNQEKYATMLAKNKLEIAPNADKEELVFVRK
jgi:hypothetical protein